jgi:hypothetical protein
MKVTESKQYRSLLVKSKALLVVFPYHHNTTGKIIDVFAKVLDA